MKKFSTIILFLMLVLCTNKMFAQISYYEANVNNYGKLEQVLGDKWDKIDSLVVNGPVDATDINMMWKCAFYGHTKALNLQNAQVKDNTIPDNAFYHEDVQLTETSILVLGLNRVILPESIEKIGDHAFERVLLEHINMPANLKTLGKNSFDNCKRLEFDTLTIPEGLKMIDYQAFYKCGIDSIVFPSTLKSLGSRSCELWNNINEIYSLSPIPPLCKKEGKKGVFNSSDKDIPVYVPAGSVELYRKAEGWKDFTNIMAISEGNISLDAPDVEADNGNVAKLYVNISGGKAPYNVTWYDRANNKFANETYYNNECTAYAELTATVSEDISIKVVDKKGASAITVMRLKVRNMDNECATFDDLYLGDLHLSNGRYKEVDNAPDIEWFNSFVSGPFSFASYSPSLGDMTRGFTCTNLQTSDFVVNDKQLIYTTAAQSGYKESTNYVAICDSAYMTLVCGDKLKSHISGFYVSSSAASYKSVKEGSVFAPEFMKGDYLCLTITDEITGKSVDFYVADYRSDNEFDHYCLDSWQWVDLRSLNTYGSKLKFKLHGTQIQEDGATGNTMPAIVCIDDFNGTLDTYEVPAQTLTSGDVINLVDILPLPDNGATVEYSVYDISADNSEDVKCELNGTELKVSLSDNTYNNVGVNVIVKQLSAGIACYASIPLTVTLGINEITSNNVITDVYTSDGRRVNNNTFVKGVNIIRMNDGTVKKVVVK